MDEARVREKKTARANRYTNIGIAGRKTGVTIKTHIHQDEDGFDNVDDFFQSSESEIEAEEGEEEVVEEEEEEELQTMGSRVSPDSPVPQDIGDVESDDSFTFSHTSTRRVTQKSIEPLETTTKASPSPRESSPLIAEANFETEPTEYEDVEAEYPEFEEQESEEEEKVIAKKTRKASKPSSSQNKKKKRYTEESDDEENVRRSHRTRVKPVEFWKNERVVYELEKEGSSVVPVVKEVVKVEENKSINPVSRLPKRRVTKKPSTQVKENKQTISDDPIPAINVLDWGSNNETEKSLVVTKNEINPIQAQSQTYGFQKFFTDGEFMSSGIIEVH
ncbi:mitotic fidelity of chromosome transmission- protein [Basidiobolus ranarum]|uniref:Mitotic fidelity of chromosome transmission-protein n=1 Tax=Basidiobolus ranarum TaxID=34480 RepID=A0ABR2WIL4_9FUNG